MYAPRWPFPGRQLLTNAGTRINNINNRKLKTKKSVSWTFQIKDFLASLGVLKLDFLPAVFFNTVTHFSGSLLAELAPVPSTEAIFKFFLRAIYLILIAASMLLLWLISHSSLNFCFCSFTCLRRMPLASSRSTDATFSDIHKKKRKSFISLAWLTEVFDMFKGRWRPRRKEEKKVTRTTLTPCRCFRLLSLIKIIPDSRRPPQSGAMMCGEVQSRR